MSSRNFDVVVIGGGLHGLSAAMHIAREGLQVLVLEKSWVGRHASGATAAGVRTLNRDLDELDLAIESMAMWHNMADIVGDTCGFHPHGQICVAENEADLLKLRSRVQRLQQLGYTHEEIIDRQELQGLVPKVSGHCIGASIARNNGSADPHRMLRVFRLNAEEAGVVIKEQAGVDTITRSGAAWTVRSRDNTWTVPYIVNAAGAWAANIASMVGDDISMGTKASMMMVTERLSPFIKPVVSAAGRTLSFKQSDQGTLVIGGGLQGVPDLQKEHASVRMSVLAQGAYNATRIFPDIANVRIVRVWAGLEAKTDDLLPIVGKSKNAPGVFHAFGFSGHGFELVPIVGATISDLIVRGHTQRKIDKLQIDRFISSPAN